MKICPQCQSTYTDDSLQFCLQDGTPLDAYTPAATGDWSDSETLVSAEPPRPPRDRIQVELPSPLSPTANTRQNSAAEIPTAQTAAKKSNTLLVVAATALGVVLLLGIGGAAAWFYFRSKQPPPMVANVNSKTVNTNPPNANQKNNANTATPSPSLTPSPTPTPKPTLRAEQVSEIEDNVTDVIENWRQASDDRDVDAHLGNYADTIDYYNAGRVGASRVRADKQRAFESYETMDVSIGNIKVKPDETGEKATAVFDKEWTFAGEERYSSGKVQQQLQLAKIGGKWRITGEKDLKIYYVNK